MTPKMISACEAHAISIMAAVYPTVPVVMEGQPVPSTSSIYVRFWVIPSEESNPVGLGADAKSRNVGIIQADVYGPKDRGAGETSDIAFVIATSLHRLPLQVADEGWVIFRDKSMKPMGVSGEEFRYMVRVPYRYDFS